uniref:Death domain-containing protein n=1 Tax=Ditylenchus dipsaci TaxID=166011 RepID=A0A915D171_9BILA
MERSLQSTFPRIQVAMRRSMRDFQDPMDAELNQWQGCSKMCSGQMEALVRLHGDAVEVQVRGPAEMAPSCVYFLEDIANLVEQTASEVAPGISIERHFLSPKHLKDHKPAPATFPPEEIMAMQQRESLKIQNSQGEEEMFTDVVCFGSRDVAAVLTLGIDVSVSQLQLASRCELASLLDPPEPMGRDWSILAVKLNLEDQQIAEVDSTGLSCVLYWRKWAGWMLGMLYTEQSPSTCSPIEEHNVPPNNTVNSPSEDIRSDMQLDSPVPPADELKKHDSGVVSLSSHSATIDRSCNASAQQLR